MKKFLIKTLYYYRRLIHILFVERFGNNIKYNWSIYPRRYQIINEIINLKNSTDYLEIGCFKNENFNEINISNKIGVDPISGGTHRMTSDQFFLTNKNFFDLIFIDGLHTYDQVKKDILNSLKFLRTDGIILIHDCLPRKIWYQTPKRMSFTWNGDVWKALVECRTNLDIDVYTILADEGIGAIFKRKNKNPLNIKISYFGDLKFKDYYFNHNKFMNIISHQQFMKII